MIAPLTSRVPPPGRPVDSARLAGLSTGHVKSSMRACSLLSASRAVGLAPSSTKRATLGASVTRSTWIWWKPRASSRITGNRVRGGGWPGGWAGGAGVAGAGPLDAGGGPAALVGAPGAAARAAFGVNISTRSITPRASRRTLRSRPSIVTLPTVRVRAMRSASLISTANRDADTKGADPPGATVNASPSRPRVPASVAFRTSWASLSTSAVRASEKRPPTGRYGVPSGM